MIKFKEKKVIEVQEWDNLVEETYGRTYSFQQQDGCKERGSHYITIPVEHPNDFENDSIPEVINGDDMGVSFKAWLARDPKAPLNPSKEELADCNYYWGKTAEAEKQWKEDPSHISMFYERNFYPSVDMIANDMHQKGIIPAGEYIIEIDW